MKLVKDICKHKTPPGVIPSIERASVPDVASYYENYLEEKKLEKYFQNFSTVTSVRRLLKQGKGVYNCESGELEVKEPCLDNDESLWEVQGYTENQVTGKIEHFCYYSSKVVLATGTYDKHNRLLVKGESYSFVHHSVADLEQLIANGEVAHDSEPVLIVGAGLSAADAVLTAQQNGIPVLHAFRRHPTDRELIFNRLPTAMYPEYHRVHSMMKEECEWTTSYQPFSQHTVHHFKKDGRVILCSTDGEMFTTVRASHVIVLVGSTPNLSFMTNCYNLGVHPNQSIDGKTNQFAADCITYESVEEPGLFAMGALVGDTFVRFIIGGALGITATLVQRNKMLETKR